MLYSLHLCAVYEFTLDGCNATLVIPHQICPGLNANEIQIPYDKHHKVSS